MESFFLRQSLIILSSRLQLKLNSNDSEKISALLKKDKLTIQDVACVDKMITPVMTASAQSKVASWTHKIQENSIALATMQKPKKRPPPEHEAYPVKPQQEKPHKRQKRAKPRGGPLVPFMDLSGDEPKPYPKSSPRSSQKIYAAKAYAY